MQIFFSQKKLPFLSFLIRWNYPQNRQLDIFKTFDYIEYNIAYGEEIDRRCGNVSWIAYLHAKPFLWAEDICRLYGEG